MAERTITIRYNRKMSAYELACLYGWCGNHPAYPSFMAEVGVIRKHYVRTWIVPTNAVIPCRGEMKK